MSRFNRKVKNVLLGVAGFALFVLFMLYVRTVAAMDPFSRLRKPPEISANIGIRLEDVDLRHYSGDKLQTKARVARVDVRQDRQYLDLYGITDGYYRTQKGEFRFAAEHANWSAANKRIQVESGARVYGKDFDLTVTRFFVDGLKSTLRVPGAILGRLYDGNVNAANLTYELGSGNYSIGPASWEGMLNPAQGDDPNAKKSRWKIKSDGIVTHKDDVDTWPNGEATDGDVLVKADMVERNTKTDVVTATGHVRYFSSKTNLTCEKAVIFRKEKRAVFTENVHMVFKPKDQENQPLAVVEIPPFRPMVPDDVASSRPAAPKVNDQDKQLDDEVRNANLRKYPVTAQATKVEYWYAKGTRHGIITGNTQANQELPGGRWRHIWTTKGLYDGEKETLKMISTSGKNDTRVKTSLGDDLTCDWFQVSTKDGDDAWTGSNIHGDVFPDEEEVPKTTDKKDDKPKPAPAKPPVKGNIGGI